MSPAATQRPAIAPAPRAASPLSGAKPIGRGGLEILEEATHLLRTAPFSIVAAHAIGTIPFVLALLYYWSDMASGAFAMKHVTEASAGMAVLFLWMKLWHTVFAVGLRAHLAREPHSHWPLKRIVRAALLQTIVQPTGLIALPVAFLIALPLAWVYAFYQNFTLIGSGENSNFRELTRRSWDQACRWPGQNHLALFVLGCFDLFVFCNLALLLYLLPSLIKMLTGIESVFTQYTLFNSTFLAAVWALTYVCVDPIAKTLYVLRCFYGEAIQTGADLRAQLTGLRLERKVTMVGFGLLLLASTFSASAAPPPSPPSAAPARDAVSEPELDRRIEEVIRRNEYSWRLPREETEKSEEQGLFAAFLQSVVETILKWLKTLGEWIEKIMRWVRDLMPVMHEKPGDEHGSWGGWRDSSQIVIAALIVVLAGITAVLLLRWWKGRMPRSVVESLAIAPAPDLRDENLTPDVLPSERWLALARELAAQGELRLALRALYMAGLAGLAQRELLTIARSKSNREYARELQRRARAEPELLSAFSWTVDTFERSWYGRQPVTPDLLDQFGAEQNRFLQRGGGS